MPVRSSIWAARDLMVIGIAAGGGLAALRRQLELDASRGPRETFLVAIHRSPALPEQCTEVLRRHTGLPVAYAVANEVFQPRHIYVAPPIIISW
jgi:chemotaxis response regulator CheB